MDLQDFAYVASHDLQEPLRAVAGFCQLLEEKYGDSFDQEGRDYLEFVIDGAHRMQALLTGLLQFARVRSRGQPFAEVDCNEAFDDAVANMASNIGSAGANVSRGNLPVVSADSAQMTQLMQNLISNSIKYRNAAPPEVRMDVELHNGEWLFCLHDNGIGIDPEHRERIFVIFQRLHTRSEYAGTGIGLAVCKRIVERHHGRIWVESEPGNGSNFFFTIPANPANEP
jgi:light-regulated signal transduction histidine kinase (bacteriophytochrome)